ncbi:MAG: FUSC family protein [Candidatus Nanopelagicales bacterium]
MPPLDASADHADDDRPTRPDPSADPRPAWRRALGSTGAPLQWPLGLGAVVGGAAGAAAGWPLGSTVGTAFAAIVSALAGAVAFSAPAAAAAGAGVLAVVAATAGTLLAGLTTGQPLAAAASMAVVAVLTSAAFAAGKVGPVLGLLGSISYLIAAIVGMLLRAAEVPATDIVLAVLAGAAAGVVVAVVVGVLRRRRAGADRLPRPSGPGPWRQIWTSLRTVDAYTRDGIRRAIALGLAMLLFQLDTGRNAMWIFLGAYIVLLPTGRDPVQTAFVRVAGTLVGVIAIGLLSLVVPVGALVALAVVALLGALLYSQRQPTLSAAMSAAAAALLVGAPTGAVAEWGGFRLLDTAVGCGLALLAGYLLWPKDTFRHPWAQAAGGDEGVTAPGP